MKFRWDNKYLHWGVTAFFVIAASMLFYYGIFHMRTLITGIKTFFSIMAPIIYGFAIAYILSPIVNFLEKQVIYPFLKKKERKLEKRGRRVVRWVCVLLSLFFLLIIIYTLIMMVLPQLIRSVMNIIYSFPYYVRSIENWLNAFIEKGWKLDTEMIDMLNQYSVQAQDYLSTNILPQMQQMLKNISAGVFDILIFLKNFLIGAIVSIYVLADKEIFVARSKMVVYALLPAKLSNTIIHAMRFTHQTFGGFISGKILDSAIIGVLCYIGTTILDMPYAILVSVVVGVTNVIPFFGPYLGAIPCILLILLVDPLKSLYFAIFILILQQFDGNILGPKILGDSTGLSSFMVIVAIMIGGGLFGIIGMVIGVPVCAVLYAAAWKLLGRSLDERKMPSDVVDYCNIDCLDPRTREAIPMPKEAPDRKLQELKRMKNPDGMFMKIWNLLCRILKKFWELLKVYGKIVWEKIKVISGIAAKKTKELYCKCRQEIEKRFGK
ncbi:MAG: AI-2E family transporter [Eubacteriales bacterium]|nr:AI-2E family transporter [Eubacteriales bacterium]